MMKFFRNVKAAASVARQEIRREEGQGSFEWLLLIGVVVVALIAAVTAGFPGTLVTDVITSMSAAITGLFS
jgi:uncharacterized membrane protein SpoIIM required for sporulation